MTISSKNQTILVLSDIHQEIDKVQKILEKESFDQCCILGDYFDSHYHDTDEGFEKTCHLYLGHLSNEKFHILHANHDINYLYHNTNNYVNCSGWEIRKQDIFDKILGTDIKEIRKKLHWHYWVDDYLCTHAGLHESFLGKGPLTIDKKFINKFLKQEVAKANKSLKENKLHWFYGAGWIRGGNLDYGGILWQDFRNEFEPTPGLNQIFGHTCARAGEGVRKLGDNYCIDCLCSEYLVINNGKIEIKKYIDL